MPLTSKPDMSKDWASTGVSVQPSDLKIAEGWVAEKPPFQTFNWWQKRADNYLQHLDERGAPEYDALVIYSIGSQIYFNNETWQSLTDSNLGNSPVHDGGHWTTVSELRNPVGMVTPYAGSGIPTGWLQCNGAPIDRAVFSRLFTFIGTTYGIGDGSSTFNIPNLIDRAVIGAGPIAAIADEVGSEEIVLSSANMPSHNHTASFNGNQLPAHSHNLTIYRDASTIGPRPKGDSSATVDGTATTNSVSGGTPTGSVTVNNNGSNSPVNNIQPSMGMNYIIKF